MTQESQMNEPSLIEIIGYIRRHLVLSLFVVVACVAGSVALAYLMTPIYRATIVVTPSDATGRGESVGGGQLGGLAVLAGLKPDQGNVLEEAIAILESRLFARQFIEERDLLPVLFAGRWDAETNAWTDPDSADVPSLQDGVKLFNGSVRQVIRDRDTGLISLRVDWSDPVVAAEWANEMITMANRFLQDRAIRDAEKSIEYLNNELGKTVSIEIRESIFGLMEGQIQNIMYANVQDEFAFSVIDPAIPPEADDYVRPNRPLIVFLGLFGGFFLVLVNAGIAVFRGKS